MKPSVASTMASPGSTSPRTAAHGRPRATRVHHPIAVRPVEPGAVLEDLTPHGLGHGARLVLPGAKGCQWSFLEGLRPLVAPPDDPALRRHEGDHVAQETAPNADPPAFPGRPRSGRGRRRGHDHRRSPDMGRSPASKAVRSSSSRRLRSAPAPVLLDSSVSRASHAPATRRRCPPGGQLLVREAGGSVDDPGETAAQAGPVLIDTGACQGEPVEGPEKRNGTSLVHRLTGLILVASCPYWS